MTAIYAREDGSESDSKHGPEVIVKMKRSELFCRIFRK